MHHLFPPNPWVPADRKVKVPRPMGMGTIFWWVWVWVWPWIPMGSPMQSPSHPQHRCPLNHHPSWPSSSSSSSASQPHPVPPPHSCRMVPENSVIHQYNPCSRSPPCSYSPLEDFKYDNITIANMTGSRFLLYWLLTHTFYMLSFLGISDVEGVNVTTTSFPLVHFHHLPFHVILITFLLFPWTSISTDQFSHTNYIVPLTHHFSHIPSHSTMRCPSD